MRTDQFGNPACDRQNPENLQVLCDRPRGHSGEHWAGPDHMIRWGGRNRAPLLGWHPPAELSAWVRAEARRRGVNMSVILTEAIRNLRDAVRGGSNGGPE